MVWTTIRLFLPIQDDDIDTLQTGDRLLLNGPIYSMRDKALQQLIQILENKKTPPLNLTNGILHYRGPSPTPEGEPQKISMNIQKQDPTIIRLMKELKIRGIIGTGQRSDIFRDSCKTFKSLYLEIPGENDSHITHHTNSKKPAAFEELGSEAIFKVDIKNLPLIVINDIYGRDLYEIAKTEDSKTIKEIFESLNPNNHFS